MRTETFCILITLVAAHTPIVPAAAARGNSAAEAIPANQSIPWDAIGAAAARQCPGAALAVSATDDGAPLHCAFQKIESHATAGGLWLTSTTANSSGERFCLAATTLRRTRGGLGDDTPVSSIHAELSELPAAGVGERSEMSLASTGKVRVVEAVVRWERSGLTEEYSVGHDGVRQDFIIERRPPGEGHLRLELALSGAQAEAAAYGAKLVLNGSHRELAYSRLRATDSTGKELPAKLEVLSAGRLAVWVDDQGAVYPVRVDPTFSDANWVSLGGLPGADGTVFAMIICAGGELFHRRRPASREHCSVEPQRLDRHRPGSELTRLCHHRGCRGQSLRRGRVSVAGGITASNIVRWNGSGWLPLGSGISGGNATVDVLTTDRAGNLYVGGEFTTAGGITVNNIAKWNGTSWSALGSGMGGSLPYVFGLAFDSSGNLYAGGFFTTAGGGHRQRRRQMER